MAIPEAFGSRTRSRNVLAWLLVLGLVVTYVVLPDASSSRGEAADARADEAGEEHDRLEILDVSPHDPYRGGTIAISHTQARSELEVFAGKVPLRILARRGDQLVAALPRALPLGDLKIRIANVDDDSARARSKPFHIRLRVPSYRKLFRSLVGGAALVVLGIFFLGRGVRASTSLHAARLLAGASRKRSLLLSMGALLGALAQTTTGAIGLLSGLVSSRVLGITPAAVACLAVPLGAAAAPLLVAGLIEPREGLLIVAIGVVWLLLSRGRRLQAGASLVLGTGLLAFGIQVFRPALEPFLSDAAVWSLASDLRADGVVELVLCAGLGGVAVAIMHGPAPLIVLLLGVAQATHHADLRTLLALLSGTSAGAALAALITAPASPSARGLAKLHLALGLSGSVVALLSVDLWVFVSELLLGPLNLPLHWTDRAPVSELGLRLFVGFGLSQLLVAGLLAPLVPGLAAWLGALKARRDEARAPAREGRAVRSTLDQVLSAQRSALLKVAALATTGERRRGQEAERALDRARRDVEGLLDEGRHAQLYVIEEGAWDGVAFSLLQLQNALDHLLHQTERMIDARVAGAGDDFGKAALPWDQETLLQSLHDLLDEGLEAARQNLATSAPLDLDAARVREIQINRIEATTRGTLLQADRTVAVTESRLHVLQVVDAYEAFGNQLYRLAELLCQHSAVNLSTIRS